jgi:ubiquinone/menaquinone biosynthesis C-methylase UbiE
VTDRDTESVRESYDRLAEEYARRIFDEPQYKPLDRELLDRFAAEVRGRGEKCDMGRGPGHVARYLRDAGATVFGLDLSHGMLEQARKLNPGILFREGNMMALDLRDEMLAGVGAFYAILNKSAGLVIEEIIEREPYPEVEYQSRRAYILARKPAS